MSCQIFCYSDHIYLARLLKRENLISIISVEPSMSSLDKRQAGKRRTDQALMVPFAIDAPWTRCRSQLMKHAVGYQQLRLLHNSQFYLENESNNRLVPTCSRQKHRHNKPNKSPRQSQATAQQIIGASPAKSNWLPFLSSGRPNSDHHIDYVHTLSKNTLIFITNKATARQTT